MGRRKGQGRPEGAEKEQTGADCRPVYRGGRLGLRQMPLSPKITVVRGKAGIYNQALTFREWLASYGKRICLFAAEQPLNLDWVWGTLAYISLVPSKPQR